MIRNLLIYALIVGGVFYGWDWGVSRGEVGRYIESRPGIKAGDYVLVFLAGFHELWNQNDKALLNYKRVTTLYPKSRWAETSQYGVAASLERLHQKAKALKEYEQYIKTYPNGRYSRSVKNNIDLLKM